MLNLRADHKLMDGIKIRRALISVFYKEGLAEIIQDLNDRGVEIFSTGGTKKYIQDCGIPVKSVESITGYPSILGGRVKTLHPAVFGGILARKDHDDELSEHQLPRFDLVIVDLYPFEETVQNSEDESEIIEKIDIGGISLIRAAAKNYRNCLIVSSRDQYGELLKLLVEHPDNIPINLSKKWAASAFRTSNHYDAQIFQYFNEDAIQDFTKSIKVSTSLRYGENPHQEARFFGQMEDVIQHIQGKALSYNNLIDIDSALHLIEEFNQDQAVFAVIKHTNACGLAIGRNVDEAWDKALAGDPVSAFGGILICNQTLDLETAKKINKIFFEVLLAPQFTEECLAFFSSKKKKRCLIQYTPNKMPKQSFRSAINGVLVQGADSLLQDDSRWELKSKKSADEQMKKDLMLANAAVKHLKSNAIALVKNKQLIGIGCGQTSRVDALNQAIDKAKRMELPLKGAVLASDAFFPFGDCIEIAHKAGISALVEPGGSIRDQETVDYAIEHQIPLYFTGIRHFKH